MKRNTLEKLITKLTLVITLLCSINATAQKELRQLLNQSVTIDNDHVKIRAHILAEHHEFKIDDELLYHWFLSGKIHHTRGGYSGKILEGEYTEFYVDNKLKTKGDYHLGLKHGTWTSWNEEGEHKSVINWKKGVKHGKYKSYNSSGNLIKEGSYKNGLLHGKQIEHAGEGSKKEIFYKEGEEVTDKKEIEKIEKETSPKMKKRKKEEE